ncbi:hypothetical protein [Nocardia sp. NPDC050710]|uniref:hypothetical protein n=1 Tax=Nocardia sp. NPDC050710 TaxID=3157220 RepID=UPI00340B6D70
MRNIWLRITLADRLQSRNHWLHIGGGGAVRAWLTAVRIDRAREPLDAADLPIGRIGYLPVWAAS